MRKLIITLALAVGFLGSPEASASGQIIMHEPSKDWESFMLSSRGKVTLRATSIANEITAPLVLEFEPPQCHSRIAFVLPLKQPSRADEIRKDVLVSLRVDGGTRFDLPSLAGVTMGDVTISVMIRSTVFYEQIIEAMKSGSTLRIKIQSTSTEPIYLSYSLVGFTAAHNRAYDICDKARARGTSRPSAIDRL